LFVEDTKGFVLQSDTAETVGTRLEKDRIENIRTACHSNTTIHMSGMTTTIHHSIKVIITATQHDIIHIFYSSEISDNNAIFSRFY
jgi:hypothetical protein